MFYIVSCILVALNIVLSYMFVSHHCCLFVFKGEREGPLHYVDTSKAPTPASRYGGYYSIYNPQNHSGSITPLSYQSHPFDMMHLESLREKLTRLSRDKGSLFYFVLAKSSPLGLQHATTYPLFICCCVFIIFSLSFY